MLALTTILASKTARKLALAGVAAAALLGTGLYARHEHSVAAALHIQVAAEQAQVAEVTADAAKNQAQSPCSSGTMCYHKPALVNPSMLAYSAILSSFCSRDN